MNGGKKRRFPVTLIVCSILVLVVSVVTAQQVFDGNRQPAFVRRQPTFQQQQPNHVVFQQNRNFVLPSASPLRHRNLFTRQISHRHRPRQRSSFLVRNTTHQPAQLTSRRLIPTLSHKKTRSRTTMSSRTKPNVTRANANQRTTKIKSNISRRQPQQFQQQRQPFIIQQRQQQFRFQQQQPQTVRVQRVQNTQRVPFQNQVFMRPGSTRSSFPIRAPLSPMPFGSVQRTPSSLRRPIPPNRLSIRPPPTAPQTLTTTTPIPSTTPPISSSTSPPITTTTEPVVSLPSTTHVATVHSVGGSLRRPIRVQQLQLNLRRKPQMTRGQFRRPHPNSRFPLTRHQPTHRVTKPDRVTRPIATTTTVTTTEPTTTTEEVALTVAGTTPEAVRRQPNDLKKVDDIEAAILQAVIESSSPEPPPTTTTVHRQRIHRIRPGHRHRPAPPPRVDAIEEAVLRAVLEATPASPLPEETTMNLIEETTTTLATTEEPITSTTEKSESTSLFPAFASRRHGHRRPPTTVIPTTVHVTTESTTTSTEEPTTTTVTTEATTTSEELTTTVTEGTTTESVTDITIALPEEFEDINAKTDVEDHQLHQIEENVISALSTPTSTVSPSPVPPSPLPTLPSSSPSPPSPPAPPREFSNHAGPPGSMPPSDDIVDELNGSSDFLQVAEKLRLLRRLLQ
ncbi:unnamed protein product [Caenorhabditis brenneri]